ncbi:pyrroloquinoline quinone biosynthesis protein PqqE [soil metagenome]
MAEIPYGLLAEVTHRCPLQCLYCSNPIELKSQHSELETTDWLRVIDQANDLGIVQIHLSGGEPLARQDLEVLVRRAAEHGIYTNLITSGIGLSAQRARVLKENGLDAVQLSIQSSDVLTTKLIAGVDAQALKFQAAQSVVAACLPLHMNVVLHRHNLDHLAEIINLCITYGAERIELANAQYYGWAKRNLNNLLPTFDQLKAAEIVYREKKDKLKGAIEIVWVLADYFQDFPKPCMNGWGRVQMTVAPDGTVLPCPAAESISTLEFENVQKNSLGWIWNESISFNKYRGFDWMQEPCKSCERRSLDFGGCRCQAFALTGSAENTDPVCHLSADHHLIETLTSKVNSLENEELIWRKFTQESSQ